METPTPLGSYQPASNPMFPREEIPSPATPSPKPASSMRVVWIVLVGIVVLAGAAYGWMKLYPSSPVALESASPTPTATADPTTGWKTYTNTQSGFEIRYPNSWFQAQPSASGCCDDISTYDPNDPNHILGSPGDIAIRFLPDTNPAGMTLDAYAPMGVDFSGTFVPASPGTPILATQVMIGQYEGRKIDYLGGSSYFVVKGPIGVHIIVSRGTFGPDPLLDSILSTFKFTP